MSVVLGAPAPRAPCRGESPWSKSRSLPPPIAAPVPRLLRYLAAGGHCHPEGRGFTGLGPVFLSRVVKRSFRVIWVVPLSTGLGRGWAAILQGGGQNPGALMRPGMLWGPPLLAWLTPWLWVLCGRQAGDDSPAPLACQPGPAFLVYFSKQSWLQGRESKRLKEVLESLPAETKRTARELPSNPSIL